MINIIKKIQSFTTVTYMLTESINVAPTFGHTRLVILYNYIKIPLIIEGAGALAPPVLTPLNLETISALVTCIKS